MWWYLGTYVLYDIQSCTVLGVDSLGSAVKTVKTVVKTCMSYFIPSFFNCWCMPCGHRWNRVTHSVGLDGLFLQVFEKVNLDKHHSYDGKLGASTHDPHRGSVSTSRYYSPNHRD